MKSLEQIIDDQIKRWEMIRSMEEKTRGIRPVITFSREPGSGGSLVAKELADQLKLDFFHRDIIQQIAEKGNISEGLSEILDEKGITMLDDWISTLVNEKHLWPDQYLQHLLNIIGTIGRHGGAVIVGRGSCFIIPPEVNFRVRVVAPLDTRIQNVVRDFGVLYDDAKQRILKTESDRSAFIRKYFHKDVEAAVNYDLVLNTEGMSIAAAVDAIRAPLEKRAEMNESMQVNMLNLEAYSPGV